MKKVIISLGVVIASALSFSVHAEKAPAMTYEQASMACYNRVQGELMPAELRAWGSEMLDICQKGIYGARTPEGAQKVLSTLNADYESANQANKKVLAAEYLKAMKFFTYGLSFGGMSDEQIMTIANNISGLSDSAAPAPQQATSAKKVCDVTRQLPPESVDDETPPKIGETVRKGGVIEIKGNDVKVTFPWDKQDERSEPLTRTLTMSSDGNAYNEDDSSSLSTDDHTYRYNEISYHHSTYIFTACH